MSELFREIEEDIRRERIDKLWHSFGKVMVAISLLVIGATIVVVVMQSQKQSSDMENTSEFIKGTDRLNIEDYKGAIPIFSKLSEKSDSPYYGLAMLRKAQAEKALGDSKNSFETYHTLAQKNTAFGELAKLIVLQSESGSDNTDKNSAFYYSQSELKGWQLLKNGKKDNAVAEFYALYQNNEAPSSMHTRMTEVLHHLAPEKLAKAPQSEKLLNKELSHE